MPAPLPTIAWHWFATPIYIAGIDVDAVVTVVCSLVIAIYGVAIADYSVAIAIYISAIDAGDTVITTCSAATAVYSAATNTDGVAIDADRFAMKAVPNETNTNIGAIEGYITQLIPYL